MNKIVGLFFLLLSHLQFFGQPNVDFYSIKTDTSILIFANNTEFCPVTAQFSFNTFNLVLPKNNQSLFVVPSKTNNYLVFELIKIDPKKSYKYSYKVKSNFGDATIQTFDSLYEYDLPFPKLDSFKLEQGYNGKFSHQNENALDFAMPEGTQVFAARNGIVVAVVQEYKISCPNKKCIQYNNYVTVYHSDGTFANYAHLQYCGSLVAIGDSVKQGDVIAISGNTGFTIGPHLHFVCYLPDIEKRRTIETYFKINDGTEAYTLEEGEYYKKEY